MLCPVRYDFNNIFDDMKKFIYYMTSKDFQTQIDFVYTVVTHT